jgi:hypothetical protein
MGTIKKPLPVKLFIGMLSPDPSLFDEIKKELQGMFSPVDLESPVWPWGHTDYYAKEMGEGLKRKFIFFERLINPESIAEIKLKTIELEKQYLNPPLSPLSKGGVGGRRINLDPGYLDSSKLVLVTTKNYSHRIYLRDGIYGEVTLIYSRGQYQALPYTYPDYRTEEYLRIFKSAREIYRSQISSR